MKSKAVLSIQLLRGVAALAVLLMHVSAGLQEYYDYSLLQQVFAFGHGGVDIFFVISGCLMMYVHHKDIGSPTRWVFYMQRRVHRIYPTYWVAFFAVFGLYFFQGRIGAEFSWEMVLKSFFLIPQDGRSLLVVSWTLVYEMLFYVIFGLLILNKRLGRCCLTIWLGLIVLFNIMGWSFPVSQVVDLRNLEFFLGMGIGWLILHDYRLPVVWQKLSFILVMLGVAWNYFIPSGHYWPIVIPAVLFMWVNDEAKKSPVWLLYLGTISYSLYLVHVPIMLLSYRFLIRLGMQHPLVAFALTVAFCLLGAVIFYQLVEQKLSKGRFRLTRGTET